jgi:Cu+-exporting ATPase
MRVIALGASSEEEVLAAAAGLEVGSEHPLAAAILAGAKERSVVPKEIHGFESITGKGVRSSEFALGNRAMMELVGVSVADAEGEADALRGEGMTAMFVSHGPQLIGIVAVADPIKASTTEALWDLHGEGIRVIMVTGDNKITAEAVGRKLGIDEVRADVLPAGKIEIVKQLQSEGRIVAMAGDGINDAPALAQAQIGIAMGSGTDVAIESAGMTLLRGDLGGLARARALSKAVMGNIRQNLFLAFVYNVLGIPIAAGVLYPVFGVMLSPMIAALAMSLSSVSVIGNSLRLRG